MFNSDDEMIMVFGGTDNKYDYQKVPMAQNVIMTPDMNDKNFDYETLSFT